MATTIGNELDQVAHATGLPVVRVEPTIRLLEEGNTVPFIARYRKDQTGGLDDDQVRLIQRHAVRLNALMDRKQTILKAIQSQGKLTDALAERVNGSRSWRSLEDLYLPYKPKKRTLAEVARRRGLEPLAEEILTAQVLGGDLDQRLTDFVTADNGLPLNADVLLGVGHLLAECFIERADLRSQLRKIYRDTAELTCRFVANRPPRSPADDSGLPVAHGAQPGSEPASNAATPGPKSSGAADADGERANLSAATSPNDATEQTQRAAVAGEQDNLSATPDDSDPEPAQTLSAKIEGQSADELVRDRPPNADQTDQDQPHKPADSTAASDVTEQRSATAEKPVPITSPKTKRLTKKEQKRRKLEAAYKDYDGSRQRITKMPPYRVLAINRGERAKVLSVKLAGDTERMLDAAESLVLPAEHPYRDFLKNCLRDAITRLLLPSLERELRREITEIAEEHAVQVFARNLRKLLLQPPVRDSRVLAIAPGFKSGCAVAALDEFGEVLAHDKIFLVGKKEQRDQGRQKLAKLINEHRLSIVAIGNGTACREVEQLVADVIGAELKDSATTFVVVNEAGASVYSTSQVGREELPDYDPVLRGAISIGRRLLDPLSELAKINPANIGVGLYQHDVKAKHLRESLDAVVESCVNYVGVDVNTASPSLLRYVSGLNQLTARRLYEYRREHGPFRNRQEFKRVTNLGDATFVQSAGFLRITDGGESLDATWVHPESYELAGRVMGHLDSSVAELGGALRTSATTDGAATEASTQPKAMEFDSVTEPTQDAIADLDAAVAPVSGERPLSTSSVVESDAEPTQDATADLDAPVAPVSGERPQSTSPVAESDAEPTQDAIADLDAAVAPVSGERPLSTSSVAESHTELTQDAIADSEEPSGSTSPVAESPPESSPDPSAIAEPLAVAPASGQATTGVTTEPRGREFFQRLCRRAETVDLGSLAAALDVGKWLLEDLLAALTRPGRDPREDFPTRVLRREILKLEDFKPGMELSGTVVNVVDFGAFVDIGLADSGLVHVSHLASRFIQDPHEAVSVGDLLRLWVLKVDPQRRRVSLTAVQPGTERRRAGQKSGPVNRGRQQVRRTDQREGGKRRTGRGKRPVSVTARSSHKPKRPPKPVRPITEKMEQDEEPMRTFSDLLQYYDKKKEDRPESS